MALNLLRAGFRLTVHNRHPERTVPLREAGAAVANTPAEAAAAADLLLICVSDDAAVEAVLLEQPGAAIEGLRPGALVIDCSTIAPTSSCRLAARLAERNIGYLDAPVTGGTEGARAGTLSVLVGGSAEHLERARPLLEVIGGRITRFGAVGAGQRAKAVNQVLVAGSYAAVAEALALAERLGLDRPQVVEALKGGAAGSWALEHRSAGMIADHYPLGFKLALHRKDLAIALAAAAEAQLTLPITAQVAALEEALISAGEGEQDVSVLARWFRVRG
jgi:3-hydroxyisobutyrate dehydrogenase-like beta-hydroxyacid dehydrogenase